MTVGNRKNDTEDEFIGKLEKGDTDGLHEGKTGMGLGSWQGSTSGQGTREWNQKFCLDLSKREVPIGIILLKRKNVDSVAI